MLDAGMFVLLAFVFFKLLSLFCPIHQAQVLEHVYSLTPFQLERLTDFLE